MVKIGVISDTHGLLREEVLEILRDCDCIFHGGDINNQGVLDALGKIAPVYVVRGNNDREWAEQLPHDLTVQIEGWKIFMVHNRKEIENLPEDADIVIFGHSHKYFEQVIDGRLWLNPGSLRMTPMGPDTQALSRRFTAMLARRTLSMNDRIQILSKSTLRGKILAFLSQYAQKYGPSFTIPFDRQSLATYLGANRTALSRALSSMRRDGILDYHKNHFTVREPMQPE